MRESVNADKKLENVVDIVDMEEETESEIKNLNVNGIDEYIGSSRVMKSDYSNESHSKRMLSMLKSLETEEEPFFFESDALALRNNSDYSCLLRTLVLLEGQRVKASEDIQTLITLKKKALEDPLGFIKLLGSKKSEVIQQENILAQIPPRQKVYTLPEIDWDKYYECVDLSELEAIKMQNSQRSQSLRQSIKLIQQQEQLESTSRSSSRQKQQQKQKQDGEKNVKNYNKSWSVEEQRHLEELLLEYPPEDNEAARFRKIANKLGTRTPLQVQSHCQKYFIKLAKAGLPIPGRMPNLKTYVTKKGTRGNRRSSLMRGACSSAGVGSGRGTLISKDCFGRKMVGRGVSLNEISSMWTSFNPPITMNDDNEQNDEFDFENDLEGSNSFNKNGQFDNYNEENEEEEEGDEECDMDEDQFSQKDEEENSQDNSNSTENFYQEETSSNQNEDESTNHSYVSSNNNNNYNSFKGKISFNFSKNRKK